MIPIAALSRFILTMALDGAEDLLKKAVKKEAEKQAKLEAIRRQLPAVRALLAEQVANAFAQQVQDKARLYIETIQSAEIEISANNSEGEKLTRVAENALRRIEVYLESQGQDGPIISYLKERYKKEGVRKITGRLYGGHYVQKKSEGVYDIYNRMVYAPLVDKNKPWLSSDTTAQGVGDIIAAEAEKIFNEMFEVDLTEDQLYSDI